MPIKLGIGITSYNRYRDLETCLFHVRELTPQPFSLVVADDGSTDDTRAICARQRITCVTGENMGIAWNKNRALFFLHEIFECDVIILLEDDCYPNRFGWHYRWVRAAQEWGHVNFAGNWFCDRFLDGEGTVTRPFLSTSVSGQCVAFSRRALRVCGFLDPRFRGYGYEHSEHSSRLVRAGFGGEMRMGKEGKLIRHYYLLAADLTMLRSQSHRNEESIASNRDVWKKMSRDPIYRYPWRTSAEFRQFRGEIKEATLCANLSWCQRLIVAAKWARWRWLQEASNELV
jgi:glycosyltransferase involved in cell wall biosynthesis